MRFAAGMAAGVVLAMISGGALARQTSGGQVAAAAKPAEVSFQFERTGVPVPRFTLRVNEDGTGHYQAEEVEGPADGGTMQYASAKHIDRTLELTAATVTKIFKAARELDRFDMECAAKTKNIADTGKKTLSYTGTDGAGSCTYNYSGNKDIEMLTNTFIAIAFTMDDGRRLAFLHQYDRLGLDAEMIGLEREAAAGRALELGTIAPVLTSIAGDGAVMQRVRLQAARLLKQAGVDNHGSNKI
ncbi:MAG TPA: hypothetical protein VGU67_00175 [Edaphobacter sp.]|nr:hypothetical protein [Edaphobacter sp.]